MSWDDPHQPSGPIPGSGGQPDSSDPHPPQQPPYPPGYPQPYPQSPGYPQAQYPPQYQSAPPYQADPRYQPGPQYPPDPPYQTGPPYQPQYHYDPAQYDTFLSVPPPKPPRKINGVFITSAVAILVLGVGSAVLLADGSNTTPQGLGQPTFAPNSILQSYLADGADGSGGLTDTPPATTDAPTPSASVSVALPADANGLVQLTSTSASREVAEVRKGVTAGGAVYDNVLVGAYGPKADGDYRLVLVDQAFTNLDPTDLSEIESTSPAGFVTQFVAELKMSSVATETSSDPDAALTCGYYTPPGKQKLEVCVWDDSVSFGYAYFYSTYYTTGMADAATDTDALRAAAEGG